MTASTESAAQPLKPLELEGRRALVTGGTKGIGEAIVKRLAGAGARVATTARSASAAGTDQVAELFVRGDLSTPAGAAAVAEALIETFGGIDIVVHNAGGTDAPAGPTLSFTDDDWQQVINLNLLAAVRLDRLLAPAMTEQGSGAIVHITSIAAVLPTAGPMPYAAAKAAVRNYSKGLAAQLAPSGVRVNRVLPGFIETAGAQRLMDDTAQAMGTDRDAAREVIMNAIGGIPMGRTGRPADVADLVEFLVSDRAAWVSGVEYVIDGGTISLA